MPKIIKKKVIKHSKPDMDVKDILDGSREFVQNRRSVLLPVLIVIIAASIVISGVFLYRADANKKAAALEYEAYSVYYNLNQKQPLQNEEPYLLALEKFKKAYETKKTPFSLFYIANCYYNTGKYEEAIKTFKALNEQFPDDERFVPLSYYKMAVANLKKGDRETALKLLDTLYNYKTGSFKDLVLIETARIFDAMGKTEEAAKKYEELAKNFAASPFAEEAKARLGTKKG